MCNVHALEDRSQNLSNDTSALNLHEDVVLSCEQWKTSKQWENDNE